MAKIEKHGNKLTTRVYVGQEDGKKKYVRVSGADKVEVRQKEINAKTKRDIAAVTDGNRTLNAAIESFLEVMDGAYSPGEIRGCRSKHRTYIKDSALGRMRIKDIKQADIQRLVSALGKQGLAEKTIKNTYSLIRRTLKYYGVQVELFHIVIPRSEAFVAYMPTREEVKKVIDHIYETDYELFKVVIINAIAPLRRSEVCALNREDITTDSITVNKAMKLDANREWIISATKNSRSVRNIRMLPEWVLGYLPESGRITTYNPNQVTNYYRRIVMKMDVHYFRFQDLRAFAASYMVSEGLGLISTTRQAGWVSTKTADRHYFRAIGDVEKEQIDAIKQTYDYFKPGKE